MHKLTMRECMMLPDDKRYALWLLEHADPITPVNFGTVSQWLERLNDWPRGSFALSYIAMIAIPSRRSKPRAAGHRRGTQHYEERLDDCLRVV